MTGNIRDSSRVLLQGAVELLLFLPVAFLIQAFLLGNEAGWLWLILALLGYPAGLLINRLFTFKHPFMITLVGIVIGCACSALLFGVTKTGALSAVVLSASLSRGGLMAVSMRLFRLQARHYIIGIFVYFFVSLFFGRAEAFQPYKIPLIVFGLAVLMLTLFASNSSYVNDESLSGSDRPSVEPTVRKQNRMLVGIIAAVAVLIVFTYQIQAALTSLWNAFRNWLQQLFAGGGTENAPPPQAEPPAAPPALPQGDAKTLPPWVDYIMYGIVALVGLFVLYLLLRKLRHLPEWLKKLREQMLKLFGREKINMAQGYVDEVASIPKTGRLGGLFRSKSKEPRIRYRDLQDNESRLRYLYRQRLGRQVKAGYSFKPFLTPLETDNELQEQRAGKAPSEPLAQPYSEVRYGGKKITDQELQRILEREDKGGR